VKLPARFKVPPKKVFPETLRLLEMVVEPVTAREVEVAPAAVSPPLKASCVVVALPGKRYAKLPVEHDCATTFPVASIDRHWPAEVLSEDIVRFVVEAVVAVIAVVEA
jgi:hypothetical protein